MATQNLFEKYGIKEVADVTFYRIEKKEETYESLREFSVASILKGAVELRTVYPLGENITEDDGFEAYVFTDANVITGVNYDCDDVISATVVLKGTYTTNNADTDAYDTVSDEFKESFVKSYTLAALEGESKVSLGSGYPEYINEESGMIVPESKVEEYTEGATSAQNITFTLVSSSGTTATYTFSTTYTGVTLTDSEDVTTGVYNTSSYVGDAAREVGTHEFTYPQQAFMLFAKRQNLISKTGTRFQFANPDVLMGGLEFSDTYTCTPNSEEKVVILGIAGVTDYNASTYNIDEINEALKGMAQTYKAKAYDVDYGVYAELVVEDEMGYYNPRFLGYEYNKNDGMTPFSSTDIDQAIAAYATWSAAKKGTDPNIAHAVMWGNNVHYSINDAIDALKQKKLILDAAESSGINGVEEIFGGYKVGAQTASTPFVPQPTHEDTENSNDIYNFSIDGTVEATSNYALASVIDALEGIGYDTSSVGKSVRVDIGGNAKASNRAIYVRVSGAIDTAAGAHIYLLHNKKYRSLMADEDGIFSFTDNMGNIVYYQDKIFKKVEWLALVIVGNKGLIYVVNRHGTKADSRVAWMVNESGYISDSTAKLLVNNGLIHTTNITVKDETFEATAEVVGMKIKRVVKTVERYTPVLFLDTLKVSNINQTAEEVYATGGRGNSNLIGWDYNKEITLHLEDALFTPASLSAIFGDYDGTDLRTGVKDVKWLDRTEKVTAKRNFIVPAGNVNGTPSEADKTAQAVYIDPNTMQPYADGTPIAEGEVFLKWTRSIAYEGNSLGNLIEISADKFPGTYRVVGDTYVRSKTNGDDERFQFVICQCKMGSEQSIELSADGDPVVFNMDLNVLRPDNGVMMQLIQYNVVDNEEENDGSTMVKGTENLNLLDDAELYKVSAEGEGDEAYIGATEY